MALDLEARPVTHRPWFHGDGATFFGLHLITMFLTAVTFGVYYFWARVRVRSYLYGQTEFMGERFVYHGTGMELLKGWLKAGLLVGGVALLNVAVYLFWDHPAAIMVSQAIAVFFGLALAPFAIVGSRRYRLSRTSWQGIRLSFRGRALDLVRIFVPGMVLNVLTLGLYYPFFVARLQGFLVGNTAYGNERFRFDGRGRDLFPGALMAMLLTPLTFGLYAFWYQSQIERFVWDHTTISGARFRSSVSGGGLFGLTVTNWLLLAVTFGLAYPWTKIREVRYKLSHLALVGEVDLETIRQDAQEVGATAEGLADFMDLELGL